ncbi:MAG: FixH family protein [Bacteroidota bacterium]
MKLNWGTGILIVIIIFLILIISFVIFSSTQKVNLVEEDYYPKELNFDSQIEKNSNTEALDEKINFIVKDSMIIIGFPDFADETKIEGSIHVYRPSDYKEDLLYKIKPDTNGYQYIPTSGLLPGKYIVKVDWLYEGVNYFQEKVIIN